jgi:hypothetical protein
MRQSLGEISEHAFRAWVVLFRQKTDVVAQCKQALKQRLGIILSAS